MGCGMERKRKVPARGNIFGKKWVKDVDVIGADATLTLPRRTGLTGNAVRQKFSRAGVPPRSLKLQKGRPSPEETGFGSKGPCTRRKIFESLIWKFAIAKIQNATNSKFSKN